MIHMGEGRYETPKPNEAIAFFMGLEADFEEAENKKAAFLSSFCEMGTHRVTLSNQVVMDFRRLYVDNPYFQQYRSAAGF